MAGSSSQSVVGKSRTTGSFQPTRVSSTIAKHCGRVHQICVASRLQVTRGSVSEIVTGLYGNPVISERDGAIDQSHG